MKVLYFARLRQIAGKSEETVEPPSSVVTVRDLMAYLGERDEALAGAFSETRTIRAAINKSHVSLDAPLIGANEVAFFPPVTGG
ncbi:MAG: molybdopterin converting factor subunit 1 [Aestuariivirga sp.]